MFRRFSLLDSPPPPASISVVTPNQSIPHLMPQYMRSTSTPSPSLPKTIPYNRRSSTLSVAVGSAPITFNRYINVYQQQQQQATSNGRSHTNQQNLCQAESAPISSSPWYSRLGSSLKKTVLRRNLSVKEATSNQQRVVKLHRKSVIIQSETQL